jgi:hypothetical protein
MSDINKTCQDLLEDLQRLFPVEGQPDSYDRHPSPATLELVEQRLEKIQAALPTVSFSAVSDQSEATRNLRNAVDGLATYLVAAEDADPSEEFPRIPKQAVWWLQIAGKWLSAVGPQSAE